MTVPQFNRYFINYRPILTRKAVFLTATFEDAEDLVQETYLQALASIGELRRDESVRGWIHRIMVNTHCNLGRDSEKARFSRRGFRVVSLDHDLSDRRFSPLKRLSASENRRKVRLLLRIIPENGKRLLSLRYFCGCSYREIADREGIPRGTVRSRISRARDMIRRHVVRRPDTDRPDQADSEG